jgi:hypothetical protein
VRDIAHDLYVCVTANAYDCTNKLIWYWRMEFSDAESCVQDFSDLGAEYKVLEVSVHTIFQRKGIILHEMLILNLSLQKFNCTVK